jgi:hypothetical protein
VRGADPVPMHSLVDCLATVVATRANTQENTL